MGLWKFLSRYNLSFFTALFLCLEIALCACREPLKFCRAFRSALDLRPGGCIRPPSESACLAVAQKPPDASECKRRNPISYLLICGPPRVREQEKFPVVGSHTSRRDQAVY